MCTCMTLRHIMLARGLMASLYSIVVLKDGRIVEQGSHSDLLALNGVFAAMWADQISGSGTDEGSSSPKKEPITGYLEPEVLPKVEPENGAEVDITPHDRVEEAVAEAVAPTVSEESAPPNPSLVDVSEDATTSAEAQPLEATPVPEAASVAFPSSPSVELPKADTAPAAVAFPTAPEEAAPVSFPSTESNAPVAFPGSPESASIREGSVAERTTSPGVTFQDNQTTSRTGTPDPETDGKRRRTLSTQGIQRLARRISVSRRQGSTSSIPGIASIIPGLRRENTSSGLSKEDSSTPKETPKDSPAASISSDVGKSPAKGSKIRKEKKDKRKSTSP